eukprot:SAG22_NODE_461_length_10216_cov_25.124543_7_plen_96_part_00
MCVHLQWRKRVIDSVDLAKHAQPTDPPPAAAAAAAAAKQPPSDPAAADPDTAVARQYIEDTAGFHVVERQCRQMVKAAIDEIADGVKLWTRYNTD